MEPKDTPSKVEEQGPSKLLVSNNKLRNLKSDYFIQKFFGYMPERKSLEIIRYNKSIQKRINKNINHYKAYFETKTSIELDIIPMKGEYGDFIKIKEEDKKYFHIYFNDNKKKEIDNTSLNIDDNVYKISIIIDYQIKSFSELFYYCESIESIEFKKFYRNNVTNMRGMLFGCSSLKELNLNNFNTDNVTDMSYMFFRCLSLKKLNLNNFNTINVTDMYAVFSGCSSLKELHLNNFNTNNVTNMGSMFARCSSLKELNLNNFNTNNVTNMICMFYGCSTLNELNLNNFNTNNVTNMSGMFYECSSLKELNLNNFNTNNVTNISGMFGGCLDELKLKIKSQFKNFKEEAFKN